MKINKKKREEVRQFYVLVRHFVLRLFNNDILTYQNERRERVIVVMVMLAAAGGFVSRKLLSPYLYSAFSGASTANIWIEKTAFLTLTMTITGIFSVINWENIFLDKKDYSNLLVLPVKRSDLFMAKFVSLLVFIGLLSLAFNAVAVLIFTFFTAQLVGVNVFYYAFTHFITNFLANLFVFLSVAAVQALFTVLFNNWLFKKIANVIQVILLTGFMSTFVWLPRVYEQLQSMKAEGSSFLYYFPPLWFTGLYEKMLGSKDAVFSQHVYIAVLALSLPAALYTISSPLTFRRFLSRSQDNRNGSRVSKVILLLKQFFNKLFLRNSIQRGMFYFILHTLRRSKFHKLQLAMYMALPVSYILTHLVFNYSNKGAVFLKGHTFFLASISLLLYLFLVVGIRMVVRHPILFSANWVFKLTEDSGKRHYIKGLKKAVMFFGGAPLFFLLFLFYLFCWGLRPAIFHSLYSAAIFFMLLEVLFVTYRKIPFAGAYDPGKPNLKLHWMLYLVGFIQYLVSFTSIALMLLLNPKYYILFFAAAMGFIALLVSKRYEMYRDEDFRFQYDEEGPEPLMMTLNIST